MSSRRPSAESKRKQSPKKKSEKPEEKPVIVEKPIEIVRPSSSFQTIVPRPVRRVMEPLPIDGRLRNQMKAADLAFMATQLVMAVCFVVVPISCYRSMFYFNNIVDQSMMGPEPWEQYFELV